MKNKKTIIAIISIVVLLLVIIGVTYAYWLVTKTQTNSNIISSACLDITLDNEANDISLSSQYPMSDEDGMALTPYTFTVTNNCNTSIDYQVALESIGDEATAIKASALKVALDTKYDLLSNKATVDPTISGAYAAHRLSYGTLSARGSEGSNVTHSLRIWIDENAPISEMNKTFQSKIRVTIGQGIKNPYVEGTMAYDILANNDEATTLSAAWVEGSWSAETYSSVSKYLNYWYGTDYEFNPEIGYKLSGELVQATLEECRNETKACGEYTFRNSTQDYSSTTLYKITSFTNATEADTTNILYMTIQRITAKNDFSEPIQEGEGGLYKAVDDLGESYYFRGDVTNNYVQFGQYAVDYKAYTISDPDACWDGSCIYTTLKECQNLADWEYDSYDSDGNEVSCVESTGADAEKDMYWRIVRINGDGTIRLVYDGTAKVENGTNHSAMIGYTFYNIEDSSNVNYGDSDVKEVVDGWYNTHLKTNYGSYIADGIFCNDKEVSSYTYYDENEEETDADNALFTDVYYVSSDRLGNKKAPSLTCRRAEDGYTTSSKLGNGQLIHPVGLLTADETTFAGGLVGTSRASNHYLALGNSFWTASPYGSFQYYDEAPHIWAMSSLVSPYIAIEPNGVRPVINLRADVEFTGNGSFETPYVIKTN